VAIDPVLALATEIQKTASSPSTRKRWFHPDGWGVVESANFPYVLGPPGFGSNLSLTTWDLEPVCRIVAEAVLSGDLHECRRRLTGQPQKRSNAKPKRKQAPKPKEAAG
jgi:hypothetical protein